LVTFLLKLFKDFCIVYKLDKRLRDFKTSIDDKVDKRLRDVKASIDDKVDKGLRGFKASIDDKHKRLRGFKASIDDELGRRLRDVKASIGDKLPTERSVLRGFRHHLDATRRVIQDNLSRMRRLVLKWSYHANVSTDEQERAFAEAISDVRHLFLSRFPDREFIMSEGLFDALEAHVTHKVPTASLANQVLRRLLLEICAQFTGLRLLQELMNMAITRRHGHAGGSKTKKKIRKQSITRRKPCASNWWFW
jgi:hypothetical protein